MNVSFNPSYQMQKQQSPNFGMALKLKGKAAKQIKKELSLLPEKEVNNFWDHYREIAARQESNPVDIVIKKGLFNNLYAQVVDNGDNAVKKINVKRRLFERNGNLKFLDRAEHKADMINKSNNEMTAMIFGKIE